jgi:hypothetical protein
MGKPSRSWRRSGCSDLTILISGTSGIAGLWGTLVEAALAWMIADPTWQTNGVYRGGKLLDDVVDTMICLATSLSYAKRNAHVWHDSTHPDDGHIVGPGCQNDGRWEAAWEIQEV